MTHNKKLHFIVIDDSKLDCFIAERIIKNTGKSESITSFQQAVEALEYISNKPDDEQSHTIVLVDIQMPVMNGFQFVEAFEQLPAHITNQYTLYVITSSINENDFTRVHNFASVKQFLNKPLNSNSLTILLS
jgi:CheY-like chemotaxis protein